MNWVSDNWKLIVSLGVPLGAAIVGYFIKRSWETNPAPPGQVTGQGGKVSDSPVASGSGITQRVNSPTNIFVGLPPGVTPPQQTERPKPLPEEQPKLLVTGLTRTVPIILARDDTFYVDGNGRLAALVQFTNEPDSRGRNVRVTAKARIVYYSEEGLELGRVNDGCWLEERLNTKEFGFDESHELMLGTVLDGKLLVFKNVRIQEAYYTEGGEGVSCIPIPGFTSGIVDVRLTNKYTGAVLNHSRFTLTTDPLKAVLKTT